MKMNIQMCELTPESSSGQALNPSPPAKAKRRAGLEKRGTFEAASYKPLLILRLCENTFFHVVADFMSAFSIDYRNRKGCDYQFLHSLILREGVGDEFSFNF